VFPLQDPDGYAGANAQAIEAARASGGRLVPFARVALGDEDAERWLDRGARGIKLHPRADRFGLGEPWVRRVLAAAAERRAPVVVHAGHGVPSLGRDALALAAAHPGAPLVLAHAGASDLSWIWRHLGEHPSVFFDTSLDTAWWNVADLLALFALVPPGRILFGSDAPYGRPAVAAEMTVRCARQLGLGPEQLESVTGAQTARLLEGEPALDAGSPPGPGGLSHDLLLDRVATGLTATLGRMKEGGSGEDALHLVRLACAVPDDHPHAAVCAAIRARLDGEPSVHAVALAACVARTPDVPLPG
jgi:hypothetical protein